MEWDNENCIELIEEYERQRTLWDPNHMMYYSKAKKKQAWEEIAKKFNVGAEEIRKKMESLLGSFRRERSRCRSVSLVSKVHRDYKSKWYAFDKFQFLMERNGKTMNPICESTDATGTNDVSHTNDDETTMCLINILSDQDSILDEADETPPKDGKAPEVDWESKLKEHFQNYVSKIGTKVDEETKKRRKKRKPESTFEEVLTVLKASTQGPSNDPCAVFGQHVANKLRVYSSKTVSHVEHAINNILFEADMGKYDSVNDKPPKD